MFFVDEKVFRKMLETGIQLKWLGCQNNAEIRTKKENRGGRRCSTRDVTFFASSYDEKACTYNIGTFCLASSDSCMQRIGYPILGIDRYYNWLVGLNKPIDHKEHLWLAF